MVKNSSLKYYIYQSFHYIQYTGRRLWNKQLLFKEAAAIEYSQKEYEMLALFFISLRIMKYA
jgi:hypothetical protein